MARSRHEPRVQDGFKDDELGHIVRAIIYGRMRLSRGSRLERAVIEYCLMSSDDRGSTWTELEVNRKAVDFVERRVRREMERAGLCGRAMRHRFARKTVARCDVDLQAWYEDGTRVPLDKAPEPPIETMAVAPRVKSGPDTAAHGAVPIDSVDRS